MPISDSDMKILWGRAAGICSNPECREDLTALVENGRYNVGEMAHIIAHSPNGPRGVEDGGGDSYANLILLCPTCHRHIDKAPEGCYTADRLHDWKSQHESQIRNQNRELVFESLEALKTAVTRLLVENRHIFEELGPDSDVALNDPGSNTYLLWDLQKLGTIIPNNNRIINMVERNIHLLDSTLQDEFMRFKLHARGFEANQHARVDHYPLFPKSFSESFCV